MNEEYVKGTSSCGDGVRCHRRMRMDTRQLRENRSAFPADELAWYCGQWVAFSGDGRRIVACAPDLIELDSLLVAMGEDPEQVALEYIDTDDSFVAGPETI